MLRSHRPLLVDLVLCVAVIAFCVPATLDSEIGASGTVLDTILLPAVVLPLLLRRRSPLLAAAALAAGCIISGIPTFDQFRLGAVILPAPLIAFTLGAREPRRRSLAGLALVLAGLVFIAATDNVVQDEGGVAGMIAFAFPVCGVIWGAGRLVRSRVKLAGQLAEKSEQLERRRELTAALAVEVERVRLAADLDASARAPLHEMIALATAGDGAPGAFARIEHLGRDALNEMRELLGVLRSDEHGDRSPRPTLAQLDALIAGARAGGRVVELEIDGDPRELPAGVELAAYRAVQHALTSFAEREPATVRLRYLPRELELDMCGTPLTGADAAAAVVAARERVTAHGGSFRADDPAGGQRRLWAQLPLEAIGA